MPGCLSQRRASRDDRQDEDAWRSIRCTSRRARQINRRPTRNASFSSAMVFRSGPSCWRRFGCSGIGFGWWLAGYLVVVVALQVGLRSVGAPALVMVTVAALFAMLVGFEAATLRRLTLARRQWRNAGIVVGDDLEVGRAAVFRRLDQRRAEVAWPSRRSRCAPVSRRPQPPSDRVIGLFPRTGSSRDDASPSSITARAICTRPRRRSSGRRARQGSRSRSS